MPPVENQTTWQKIALLCLLLNGCAVAETKPTLKMRQLVDMPIEQLLNLSVKNFEKAK
jgi:hypothetical protein